MNDVQLIKYETREDWLAARNLSVGASESAAIFGLAPEGRESEYSLWAHKAGLVPAPPVSGEWIEWGNLLEEPIAQRYAQTSGDLLWKPPTPFCVIKHPRLPFMTATIDRWILQSSKHQGERGDLEIKNVGAFSPDWKEDGETVVPLHIHAQVQHQLACTGFAFAVVAALIGGNRLETFEIERDEDFITELEARLSEFWQRVQTKTPPPVDGKPATLRALKALHPDDNGKTIELDKEIAGWVARAERAKADKKAAEVAEKEAENHIKAVLGPNTFGTLPDGRSVSYKTQERDGYTVQPTKFRTLKIHAANAAKKGKAA